ncbi:MAG: hypothetical protein V4545_05520, partial [Pseudomonadota bacterium]
MISVFCTTLHAAVGNYSVEISVLENAQASPSQTQATEASKPSEAQKFDENTLLTDLLKQHLDIVKWRDNPRMSPTEWLRLYQATPQAIADLLATEGYFSPEITPSIDTNAGVSQAKFLVNPGKPTLVSTVDLNFTGDILQQDAANLTARTATIESLKQNWLLQTGSVFKQTDW